MVPKILDDQSLVTRTARHLLDIVGIAPGQDVLGRGDRIWERGAADRQAGTSTGRSPDRYTAHRDTMKGLPGCAVGRMAALTPDAQREP